MLILFYIFIIMLVIIIQILLSKRKYLRYLLPVITFLLATYIVLFLIFWNFDDTLQELNKLNEKEKIKELISYLIFFCRFYIPTVILGIINIIMNRK